MNTFTRFISGMVAGIALAIPQIALAGAMLGLSNTPLYFGVRVPPNVFLQIDDSGSMDWDIITRPFWATCNYDRNLTPTGNADCTSVENSSGLFSIRADSDPKNDPEFSSIFRATDDTSGISTTTCGSTSNYKAYANCTSPGNDWRPYSADFNLIYYAPENTYTPWVTTCTTSGVGCANATFTAARSNPRETTAGYTVTRNLVGTKYEIWIDDKGFSGTRPRRGTNNNSTNVPNGIVDRWDSHISITFTDASTITVRSATSTPNASGLNEVTTVQATLTNASACYNVLGDSDAVRAIYNGTLSWTSTDGSSCRTIAQAQQNFANWYQYWRKRQQNAKGALAQILKSFPGFRYGMNTINGSNASSGYAPFIKMPAASVTDFTAHNDTILDTFLEREWIGGGTPLIPALQRAGKYYEGTLGSGFPSPIIASCQQNFTLLLTDGYWDTPPSTKTDTDKDGIAGTLADTARYYYITDLSSTLANNVPPTAEDPQTIQHMVTFGITFGASGNLKDTDGDGWPNPVLGVTSNWGNPYTDGAAKVDDLWHAAFNSAGRFANANNPSQLINAIADSLNNITQRVSSSSTAAQNSSTLTSDSTVYQALFSSAGWFGELLAYPINATTNQIASTPTWNASCVLTGGACTSPSIGAAANPGIAPNSRVILTYDWRINGYQGIPFRWPTDYTTLRVAGTTPPRLVSFLANAPYPATTTTAAQITANNAYGASLVNYLRGVRTAEEGAGGSFRARTSILGDFVNSNPAYVGPPRQNYPESFETPSYAAFKTAQASRTPMIYVGANDGMLHGFSAIDGSEKIAYIPGATKIWSSLPQLASTSYSHLYTVDGSPTVSDVVIGGAWKTVLVGGLGAGGQGIYALNVTNPADFSESNASNIVMWEFTDAADPDLGFTFSKPVIAKMKNGRWAAIFGNGYNNSAADGRASTTGKAALYIVFLDYNGTGTWTAGSDYIKILVGPSSTTAPNGLSTPYAVDTNADYMVDYIYAGDLNGNIWKFNVTSTNPASWGVATGSSTTPFFTAYDTTAGDQPITAPLVVGPHPNGLAQGVLIYFGTGKYLETTDNNSTGQPTQAFYAIWDKLDGTLPSRSRLLAQTILSETTQTYTAPDSSTLTAQLRTTSTNTINYTNNDGWTMRFTLSGSNRGEKQVSTPILRNGRIIFSTILPSTDPCGFGGSSWLMELNAASGASLATSPFDLNQDGKFDSSDTVGSTYVIPGGILSSVGVTGTPAVITTSDKGAEVKIMSGSTGLSSMLESNSNEALGRQTWRELQ